MENRESEKEIIVFTNGCFDLLHPGHLDLLKKARSLGTRLIVGINSDQSVRMIKGSPRPFLDQNARAAILRELRSVDEVFIFEESTPERLIRELKPDVLVKGGDWAVEQIVGAAFVKKNGGRVFSIPFEKDFSSSRIVEKILTGQKSLDQVYPKNSDVSEKRGDDPEPEKFIKKSLERRLERLKNFVGREAVTIEKCAAIILEALSEDEKRIFICADKESAFLAELTAGELIKHLRIRGSRTNRVIFDSENSNKIFESQSLLKNGGVLLAFSFEGLSPELLATVMTAREAGCRTIALTGRQGKKLASLCDLSLLAESVQPGEISETQFLIINIWSELLAVNSAV